MIVLDTSALVSLATAGVLEPVEEEFEVHTTETVVLELEETAAYDDIHGEAAGRALDRRANFAVHAFENRNFQSSRIDDGEGSCLLLARDLDADFLVTDDLRALPELQTLTEAKTAISPVVLKALVEKGRLTRTEALDRLSRIAQSRDWLGSPIYRRAERLFE